MSHKVIASFLSGMFVAIASVAAGNEFDLDEIQTRVFATIDQVSPAVVSVSGRGSVFSGVIVSDRGHVLSAGHTVRPGNRYQVTLPDGRRFTAQGMGASESLDCGLVLISQPRDLPYVAMGNSGQLVANQPCLSLSYPGGTQGRHEPVARFGRIVQPKTRQGMIQSTALMEPGDSGGALFDLYGNLIGVHSRIANSVQRNYDVPVDTFKSHWSQLNRAEEFSDGPPLPRLGFEGEDQNDRDGIVVIKLVNDGIARKAGLRVDDVILMIGDREVNTIREMRGALLSAADNQARNLTFKILRNGAAEDISLSFPAPDLADWQSDELLNHESPKPVAVEELARLPQQFAGLESKLDDVCGVIESQLGGAITKILATKLADSSLLISKSSMVGQQPELLGEEGIRTGLEIVARDSENDLVLLRGPHKNSVGIDIAASFKSKPLIGRFLLTPDPEGGGLVSIWSTGEFTSQKRQSKGYLGVLLETHLDRGGAILLEVQQGAARSAGLQVGDIIVRMDDTTISTREDILAFLSKVDPQAIVTAAIMRDAEEQEIQITLGAPPQHTNHAADMMDKSGRRDGFTRVISHDAVLEPGKCGGPLFDLNGELVGINIARYSRVRSYAIPGSTIKSFVDQHR